MRNLICGIVAHVDAGKTTLAEALLHRTGAIRTRGRVDHGSAHLDADGMERERGITIFSNQATIEWRDLRIALVDTPGHVDFSAEAERTLQVLDAAVAVISATDGVQPHTRTMWRLLAERGIPTIVFVNKMDLPGADRPTLLAELQERLGAGCVDLAHFDDPDVLEAIGLLDDAALDELLDTGTIGLPRLRDLVARRLLTPCVFGSALHDGEDETGDAEPGADGQRVPAGNEATSGGGASGRSQHVASEQPGKSGAPSDVSAAGTADTIAHPTYAGVRGLLDALVDLGTSRAWPDELGGRVYQVRHTPRGERQCWIKVTGGVLRARIGIAGVTAGQRWVGKPNQLHVLRGCHLEPATEVPAGELCVATGLAEAGPGSGIGFEPQDSAPQLVPVLTYRVEVPGKDSHAVLEALRILGDEDPLLGVVWSEELQEVRVQLMGEVQLEVLRARLAERFGMQAQFGQGSVSYRETIATPARGVGHFEPLRHYAEVHLLLEPLPAGSGVVFGSTCSEDELDRNWQRLILTNAMERPHRGVLTGAPLTDVRITLVAGRAHPKHTEGGDFRQATYRAIRQALMQARDAGAAVLLEPWYRFALELPADAVGRALFDLQRMAARADAPAQAGTLARIEGSAPVSELRGYALDVAAYTHGEGNLQVEFAGYEPCHDAARVVEEAGYDPEADLPHTPDSVFCAHGAGYPVKWHEAPAMAHVDPADVRQTPWRPADAAFFGA